MNEVEVEMVDMRTVDDVDLSNDKTEEAEGACDCIKDAHISSDVKDECEIEAEVITVQPTMSETSIETEEELNEVEYGET